MSANGVNIKTLKPEEMRNWP